MVEFKTQYGRTLVNPSLVTKVETDGNLTVVYLYDGWRPSCLVVSDSYSEAMRKLGRNV